MELKKKSLTKVCLLKDYKYIRQILLFTVFFVAGLAALLSPFAYWEGDVAKLLTNMAVMLLFAIPFCYIIAYRNIARILRNVRDVKNDHFYIVEDVVVKKWSLARESGKNNCQIELQDYAKRSGKTIWAQTSEYNQAHRGDIYYMVYIPQKNGKEYLFAALPAKEYILDDTLRPFLRAVQI